MAKGLTVSSSAAVENARYHVATFDAQIGKVTGTSFDYNFENCQIAANLFENQRGVLVKYWCEKGFYRK